MDIKFWKERWEKGQTGFHQSEINLHLQTFWSSMGLKPGQRVFVPLCGKSLDLLWFLEKGFAVTGIEISEIAVNSFFEENNLQALEHNSEGMNYFNCKELSLICGDYYSLSSDMMEPIHAVYDRASLIAMPPEMRVSYAKHMGELVLPGTPILLVSIEYNQSEMSGPPFAVHSKEVDSLYENDFDVEIIDTKDILNEYPQFRDRGLSGLKEVIYKLVRK
ncbi:MAG: thiopurine S-methyltransferase [Leptospirales bacterium]